MQRDPCPTACHVCERAFKVGRTVIFLDGREFQGATDPSTAYAPDSFGDPYETPWAVCSKACARKALTELK